MPTIDNNNPAIFLNDTGIGGNFLSYPDDLQSEGEGHFIVFSIIERAKKGNLNVETAARLTNSLLNLTTSEGRSEAFQNILEVDKGKIVGHIAMHLPSSGLSTSYNMNYSDIESGFVGSIVAEGVQSATGKTLSNILRGAESTLDTQGLLSKRLGIAVNPRMEVIFSSPEFRTHSFSFKFNPKSKSESEKVYEIIKEFKIRMHPDVDDLQRRSVFTYPDEFQITFKSNKNGNNKYLPKIGRSYLTSLSVDFVSQQPSFFEETSAPTSIVLSMTFKETALLTKNEIKQGL